MKTPRDKYLNDPQFRNLVDMMVAHIHQCDYTPSEMREAAIMASIVYEEHNYNRVRYVSMEIEKAFKVLGDWHETSNLLINQTGVTQRSIVG